jgi:hypothetical protein
MNKSSILNRLKDSRLFFKFSSATFSKIQTHDQQKYSFHHVHTVGPWNLFSRSISSMQTFLNCLHNSSSHAGCFLSILHWQFHQGYGESLHVPRTYTSTVNLKSCWKTYKFGNVVKTEMQCITWINPLHCRIWNDLNPMQFEWQFYLKMFIYHNSQSENQCSQ